MADGMLEQDDVVRAWMRNLAAVPLEAGSLPDPQQLFWKAELLRRWDAERQTVAPIERAEPVQLSIGMVGALVLLVLLWQAVPAPSVTLIFATVLGVTALVAVAALTLRQS